MTILPTTKQMIAQLRGAPWERPVNDWPWASLLPKSWPQLSLTDFRQAFPGFDGAAALGVRFARFADVPAAQQNRIALTLGAHSPTHKLDRLIQLASPNQFVIVVPPNIKVQLDFHNTLSRFAPVINIVLGEGASLRFVEKRTRDEVFGSTSIAFHCDKGSRLHQLAEDASGASSHGAYAAFAETHSRASLAFAARFGGYHHLSAAIHHRGWNTSGNISALCDSTQTSRAYVWLMNNHTQQRSRGEIHCAALGKDQSHLQIDGWIRIGLKARGTISTLHEDALLLSEKSRVKTIPNLEILNNDVKAFHAATLGRINAAQLYYLMSRGLHESQARRLLINGFAGRVASTVDDALTKRSFEHFLS